MSSEIESLTNEDDIINLQQLLKADKDHFRLATKLAQRLNDDLLQLEPVVEPKVVQDVQDVQDLHRSSDIFVCEGPCQKVTRCSQGIVFGLCDHTVCLNCARIGPQNENGTALVSDKPWANGDFGCPNRRCVLSKLIETSNDKKEYQALAHAWLNCSEWGTPRVHVVSNDFGEIRMIYIQFALFTEKNSPPILWRTECQSILSIDKVITDGTAPGNHWKIPKQLKNLRSYYMAGRYKVLPKRELWTKLSKEKMSEPLETIVDACDSVLLILRTKEEA